VKKEQNGKKSPRRLKLTVGCNASRREEEIFLTVCVGKSTSVLLTLLFLPWALRLTTFVAGVQGSYYRMDVSWPAE